MDDTPKMNDHDLLIVVHTKLGQVQTDIREIKENLAGRVSLLELGKLDKMEAEKIHKNMLVEPNKSIDDHEKRIRNLETGIEGLGKKVDVGFTRIATWGSAAMIAIGVIEFLIANFVIK